MKSVWLVFEHWVHEYSDVIGVYDSAEAAETARLTAEQGASPGLDFTVEEYPLNRPHRVA